MYLPTAARRGNGNGLLRRVLNSTRTASTTSSPKQLVPKEVKLLRKERTLRLEYEDGKVHLLPAEFLRVHSQSALGEGRVVSGRRLVNIMNVEVIGNYGLRFDFDDLHGSGIYTWETLRTMGDSKFAMMREYVRSLKKVNKKRDPLRAKMAGRSRRTMPGSLCMERSWHRWRRRPGSVAMVLNNKNFGDDPSSKGSEKFRMLRQLFQENTKIADVIGEKVELRQAGSHLVGCCPFHEEKTPSFTVYEDTNSYFCFGCRERGDIISFVMKTQDLNFRQAVINIGKRFNLESKLHELSFFQPESKEQQVARAEATVKIDEMYRIMEHAAEFYSTYLRSSSGGAKKAFEYLNSRGFDEDTLRRFRIGASPDSAGQLIEYLEKKGYGPISIAESGVAIRTNKNDLVDAMRGRVVVPIMNVKGHVIGFGGRKLSEEAWGPKYLNTKETLIFKKRSTLYGESFVPRPQPPATAVIVEGYFDVIQLHKHKLFWAVSSLGTGVTIEHLRQASRHSRERAVTVNMDNDEAGFSAVLRACQSIFPTAMREGIDVRLAFLPPGVKDADSFLDGKSISDYVDQVLSPSQSWFLWYSKVLANDVNSIEGLSSLLHRLGGLLADSIPARKEGTGFVAKEYARTIARELADIFDRPEYEEETCKEILRSFWLKRTGGRFDPEQGRESKWDRKRGESAARSIVKGSIGTLPGWENANNSFIQRAELMLLRVIVQDRDIRRNCMEIVDRRGIKFAEDEHVRVFEWLKENAGDAGPDELFEEMSYERPVKDVHRYFFEFSATVDLEREVTKSLNAMEIRRSMNIISAVDVIVEEQMKVEHMEPRVATYVEELLSRRKELQMRIGTLHDELRNLDVLPDV